MLNVSQFLVAVLLMDTFLTHMTSALEIPTPVNVNWLGAIDAVEVYSLTDCARSQSLVLSCRLHVGSVT